ncbi:MAG: 2-oxo acid dehydrogenase subunit E2, partial [Acidimicrobiia bacterium]|nr:2-oxo acid dehydrogenase subunit E2 [Acidimicrobiia bacterium]
MTAVTEIRLPQFGMGMQEGTIITWLKREGDPVTAGEVVAEIEAEKVTEELVATGGGVLQRILVPEGETVAVNELLAVIAPAGIVAADAGEDPRKTVMD